MTPSDTISIEFLARQQAQLLEEVRAARAESREVRRTFSVISDHFSRQERRIAELRDDVETMVKLEIGGAIANLETRLETYVEGRIGTLEARLDGLDGRLGQLDGKLDAILAALRPA